MFVSLTAWYTLWYNDTWLPKKRSSSNVPCPMLLLATVTLSTARAALRTALASAAALTVVAARWPGVKVAVGTEWFVRTSYVSISIFKGIHTVIVVFSNVKKLWYKKTKVSSSKLFRLILYHVDKCWLVKDSKSTIQSCNIVSLINVDHIDIFLISSIPKKNSFQLVDLIPFLGSFTSNSTCALGARFFPDPPGDRPGAGKPAKWFVGFGQMEKSNQTKMVNICDKLELGKCNLNLDWNFDMNTNYVTVCDNSTWTTWTWRANLKEEVGVLS